MVKIAKIHAMEILGSRGNPTFMTRVRLSDRVSGIAKVPSGASTGSTKPWSCGMGWTDTEARAPQGL
ncbi:MAG: hypothetical protein ACTSPE_07125 [Candidatus Thorarchaeota archaeon]